MEQRFSKHSIAKFLEGVAKLEEKFPGNEIKVNESNPNETLNELYEILQQIELIKAQSDFLFSHFSFVIGCDKILITEDCFSNSTFATEQYLHVEDFEEISYYLFDLKIRVKANIDILEEKEGHKYWILNTTSKRNTIVKRKINNVYTKEEKRQKDILFLIFKTGKNDLFSPTQIAIGNAIRILTKEKFSSEQISKDFSVEFEPDIYKESINILESIKKQLEKELAAKNS